jgi:hypothetical protein
MPLAFFPRPPASCLATNRGALQVGEGQECHRPEFALATPVLVLPAPADQTEVRRPPDRLRSFPTFGKRSSRSV